MEGAAPLRDARRPTQDGSVAEEIQRQLAHNLVRARRWAARDGPGHSPRAPPRARRAARVAAARRARAVRLPAPADARPRARPARSRWRSSASPASGAPSSPPACASSPSVTLDDAGAALVRRVRQPRCRRPPRWCCARSSRPGRPPMLQLPGRRDDGVDRLPVRRRRPRRRPRGPRAHRDRADAGAGPAPARARRPRATRSPALAPARRDACASRAVQPAVRAGRRRRPTPVLVASFTLRVGEREDAVTLMLPADVLLAPLRAARRRRRPLRRGAPRRRRRPRRPRARRAGRAGRGRGAVRARSSSTRATSSDLAVGDVLPLSHPSADPLDVVVDEVVLARAAAGSHGSRLACLVVTVEENPA